jgi:chromosome segregation ATPase
LTELKDALEESHRKEGSLQQQISDLEANLQHQQKLVDKLQKELEKIGQLKTELEQAKKAAIQLAEANEKLTQEVNSLKKEHEDLKPQDHSIVSQMPGRPTQKETDKPVDFATKSWLL